MPLDGQAVFNWLLTPRPDNVPKVFSCCLFDDANLAPKIDGFKSAFASASSSVNFIVSFSFEASFAYAFVPFNLTNDETGEQLAFKRANNSNRCFLLIRRPIAEMKANGQNGRRKRVAGEFMTNGIKLTFKLVVSVQSGTGFSTQLPAQVISRSELNGLLRNGDKLI
ncbi:hypothetical protein niasHT_031813 [Heterodera trifolii]|uniref:Uncharacterized protein n=1 Tax=Heterodera trifolii TaxID=157864 RepID=A0ABD2IH59_9BILA